jgi:hypothetical protein
MNSTKLKAFIIKNTPKHFKNGFDEIAKRVAVEELTNHMIDKFKVCDAMTRMYKIDNRTVGITVAFRKEDEPFQVVDFLIVYPK